VALTLLLGGARSGKSALAVRIASSWTGPVVFVATAAAGDDEMAERIRRHRAARPPEWTTVEEPVELLAKLRTTPGDTSFVVDCLSLWIANLIEAGWDDETVEAEAAGVARTASSRNAPSVIVSNEVGLGIVPATPLGRRYRDLLGRANSLVAEAADDPLFVVAGRTLRLEAWP
jgi:adenosylcobinamide kinase / adenosylcobinamide-phosphate guanylyltransferase